MKKLQLALLALRVPVDFLALIVAAYTAYIIRFESSYTSVRPVISQLLFEDYYQLVLKVSLAALLMFAFAGLYTSRRVAFRFELGRIFLGCSAAIVAIIAFMFWAQEVFNSRFVIMVAWALAIFFVTIGRIAIRLVERLAFASGLGVTHLVIVGSGNTSVALAAGFDRSPALGYRVTRKFHAWNAETAAAIADMVEKDQADEIMLADSGITKSQAFAVLDFAEVHHLGFKYSADLLETATKHFDLHDFAGVPLIEFKPTRLEGWGRIYKRVFDIVVSLLLIVLFSPVMLVIAIAIAIDSRGPIFYSQDRVGERGRTFRYFKFRSMVVGAHAKRKELEHLDERKDGPMFKIKNDPRVTRVGGFIRKYSLDELPEFFLVLLGRMSLVGPRPHLPEEVAKYAPHHRKVHNIKPGITGMAQVSGRADLSFEDEVRLDLYYMENWSPALDFVILIKTPLVVLGKKGAY
jgi:exopolysaccharide biosynthesis polyprenyl glycosylphosphotransferase